MRKTLVGIAGAICGGIVGLLLYAALADTGHTPLGGNDLTESGRLFTPILCTVYGAIAGAILAFIGIVWHVRRTKSNEGTKMFR